MAARAAVAEAHAAGGRIAAFFCESIPSCAGQVIFPPSYLRDAYVVMHEEGALCIADEVRPGDSRGSCASGSWGLSALQVGKLMWQQAGPASSRQEVVGTAQQA